MKKKAVNFKQVVQAAKTIPKPLHAGASFIQRIAECIVQDIKDTERFIQETEVDYTKQVTRLKEKVSRLQMALLQLEKGDLESVVSSQDLNVNRAQAKELFPDLVKSQEDYFKETYTVPGSSILQFTNETGTGYLMPRTNSSSGDWGIKKTVSRKG
ncbi:hypothetical protein HY496_02755 [Candidatus Woesearchaeota archaeon]|nr:hypothetical protein [Candidatus Woesearchaeota archaeon]